MSRKRRLVVKNERIRPAEIRETSKEFHAEMVVDKARPQTLTDRRPWESVRRGPGRPRRGAGVKVISLSIARGLLDRSDALAKHLGISRVALIERGLEAVLEAGL